MDVKTTCTAEMFRCAGGFVDDLAASAEHATVIGLRGDLGSGKTTFVQGVAATFDIDEHVTSPTFVIQKTYDLKENEHSFKRLVHMDAYRIESTDEMASLQWEDTLEDPGNLIFIEWPEKIKEALPEHTMYVGFEYIRDHGRDSRVVSYDE